MFRAHLARKTALQFDPEASVNPETFAVELVCDGVKMRLLTINPEECRGKSYKRYLFR